MTAGFKQSLTESTVFSASSSSLTQTCRLLILSCACLCGCLVYISACISQRSFSVLWCKIYLSSMPLGSLEITCVCFLCCFICVYSILFVLLWNAAFICKDRFLSTDLCGEAETQKGKLFEVDLCFIHLSAMLLSAKKEAIKTTILLQSFKYHGSCRQITACLQLLWLACSVLLVPFMLFSYFFAAYL